MIMALGAMVLRLSQNTSSSMWLGGAPAISSHRTGLKAVPEEQRAWLGLAAARPTTTDPVRYVLSSPTRRLP